MREHVIINQDRTVIVPESEKKIGIQYDHNVNTISFDCPRYPDEDPTIDMSTMSIYINYMLADKTLGSSLAINVAVDEMDPNIIHFDWKITHAITSIKGLLSTLICIKQADADGNEIYHWNTDLIQKFFVGEGMECLEPIVDMNPDVITQLLQKINTNETEIDTLKNHTYKVIYENRLKSENETFVVGRNVEVNDVLRIYNPETLDPIRTGAEITNADGTVLGIMIGKGATSEILVESDMQSIEVYANFWLEIIRSPIITNTLRLNSLEQDIHTIELKLPFGLGIDENGNCGYVKPGEHTVTPFGSGGSGGGETDIPALLGDVMTKGLVKTYNSTCNITCEEGHKYLIFAAYLTEPTMAETHNVYVNGADIISDIISNKTGADGAHIADTVSFIIGANQTDVIARLEYEAGYLSAYQYVISFDITGYENEIDMSKMSVVQEGNSTTLMERYYMVYVGEIGGITDLNVYPQQATYYNSNLATGNAAYSHLVAGKLIFIKSLGGITTFTLNTTAEKNCLYYMELPITQQSEKYTRTVGTIEQLQMATVTGLTSTIETKVLDYDYIIQTESTGGNDASVSINGTNYLYSDVKSNPVTIDGSLELSYTNTSWTLKALTNLQNSVSGISYSQNDTIETWSYSSTINMMLKK